MTGKVWRNTDNHVIFTNLNNKKCKNIEEDKILIGFDKTSL